MGWDGVSRQSHTDGLLSGGLTLHSLRCQTTGVGAVARQDIGWPPCSPHVSNFRLGAEDTWGSSPHWRTRGIQMNSHGFLEVWYTVSL